MRTDGRGGRTQRGPNICELGPSPPSCAYTPERGQSRWSAWRPSGWPMGAVTFRAGPRCPPRSCAAPCDSLAQAGGGGEGKGRVEGAPDPQHTERGRREGGKGEKEGRKGGITEKGRGRRGGLGRCGQHLASPQVAPTHAYIYTPPSFPSKAPPAESGEPYVMLLRATRSRSDTAHVTHMWHVRAPMWHSERRSPPCDAPMQHPMRSTRRPPPSDACQPSPPLTEAAAKVVALDEG